MKRLTNLKNGAMLKPLLNTAGGFCIPVDSGVEVMRRKVHGFFYALTVLVGGVIGSREARRTQSPVCKPVTSSTALSFASSDGGKQTTALEYSMNTTNIVPLRAHNATIPFAVPAPTREALSLDEQIKDFPDLITAAIEYILADFDYTANLTANTAIAVRLLAVMADRLNTAMENANV